MGNEMQDKNMSNANTISLAKPEGETRYRWRNVKKKCTLNKQVM